MNTNIFWADNSTVSFKVKTSFEVLLFTRPHVPGPRLPFKLEPPTVQACNTFTSKGKLAVKTRQSHKLTFLPVGVLMNNLKSVSYTHLTLPTKLPV